MLRRLNSALPGLIAGILVYGAVVELAGVWFAADKLRFTTGLLIGLALACGLAVNMAVVLLDAVDGYGAAHAQARLIAKSVLRYCIVVAVFFVMLRFDLGNLYSAFIGVLGLKISAYLWPFTHKVITKLQGGGDDSLNSENKMV